MNYKEALEYIHSVCWMGSRPGLDRITELEKKLGNPEEKLNIIHVAGTNGKGSVCSMLSHIMIRAGYKTGLFTSPYIQTFNERIRINNIPISDSDLACVTEKVKRCADEMEHAPTEFELLTGIAFEYFFRERCDIVILETGLGGRLDSTNVITSPLLSVITGVDFDHTGILGDTLEKIAFEKSGIIKKGRPVVFGEGGREAEKVVENAALEAGSELFTVDYSRISGERLKLDGSTFDFYPMTGYSLSAAGEYQIKNAAAAITCVEALRKYGIKIDEESLRRGLHETVWKARFEILSEKPLVIYDGAHNPGGAAALLGNIKRLLNGKAVLAMGVMKDKNYPEMVSVISEAAESVYTVKPKFDRALEPAHLSEQFAKNGVRAKAFDTLFDGIKAALEEAVLKKKPLVITGTLYMYSEAVSALEVLKKEII